MCIESKRSFEVERDARRDSEVAEADYRRRQIPTFCSFVVFISLIKIALEVAMKVLRPSKGKFPELFRWNKGIKKEMNTKLYLLEKFFAN